MTKARKFQLEYTDTAKSYHVTGFHLRDDGYFDAVLLLDDDELDNDFFFVVAVWSTGDSFGHDEAANIEIMSVHKTLEEAENAKSILEKTTDYSVPWNGYFERLNCLEILRMNRNDTYSFDLP
jgi:hypothetical protein